MRFARYWALAETDSPAAAQCWRWSDQSQEDARRQAEEAVQKLARRIAESGHPAERYGYADRPLREPVLQSLEGADGSDLVLVTRNSYGALILNTASALFVDIDLPATTRAASGGGLLKRWFGRSATPSEPLLDPAAQARERAAAWAAARPGWGWRVYRTAAGLRLLATHAPFHPHDEAVAQVFEATGADPLYRRLCRLQESFRARLTPKPWRCRMENPPRWPFRTERAEQAFGQWQSRYEAVSARHAVCRFEGTLGSETIHAELIPVVRMHDDLTRAQTDLPLA